MSDRVKILVIEDEPCTRRLLRQGLVSVGFDVLEAADGRAGLDSIAWERPAAVVLDVGLPKIDGLEIVSRLRAAGNAVPVLMLSSYAALEDRLRGLGAGADDYLVKPFDHREVTARVRSLLRREGRRAPAESGSDEFCLGETAINLTNKTAVRAGEPVALTKTEYAILECLRQGGKRPVPKDELLRVVWCYENETATRTVETHIWRLRKKVGDTGDGSTGIVNRSGLGYLLLAK